MATVYHFKAYHGEQGETIVPPVKRTAESIERIRGEIIPGTAEEVENAALDDEGRYNPAKG